MEIYLKLAASCFMSMLYHLHPMSMDDFHVLKSDMEAHVFGCQSRLHLRPTDHLTKRSDETTDQRRSISTVQTRGTD